MKNIFLLILLFSIQLNLTADSVQVKSSVPTSGHTAVVTSTGNFISPQQVDPGVFSSTIDSTITRSLNTIQPIAPPAPEKKWYEKHYFTVIATLIGIVVAFRLNSLKDYYKRKREKKEN